MACLIPRVSLSSPVGCLNPSLSGASPEGCICEPVGSSLHFENIDSICICNCACILNILVCETSISLKARIKSPKNIKISKYGKAVWKKMEEHYSLNADSLFLPIIQLLYRYRWNTVISELVILPFLFSLSLFSPTFFETEVFFLEYYIEWCPLLHFIDILFNFNNPQSSQKRQSDDSGLQIAKTKYKRILPLSFSDSDSEWTLVHFPSVIIRLNYTFWTVWTHI